ncbi:MAG: helix-turn-helix domain-containing protein [Melioribacteraceae bacterium]|nr:helix-turn-helix domain-containing protein [Melioribacteraceae bacterium]
MNILGNDLELLSRHEAAKRMKISPCTLTKLINNGELGSVRMGRRDKIPLRELNRFLDENTVRSIRERDSHLYTETNPNDILITRENKTGSLGGDMILTELLNELKGE